MLRRPEPALLLPVSFKKALDPMKKILPLLSLATLIAAAGSAAGLARTKELPPASAEVVVEETPIEQFCSQHWGTLSDDGNLCRFEQTFHINLTHVGAGSIVLPVPVIAGDTLKLLASDDALPVVGNREYPLKSFVSSRDGYLSFRSANEKLFLVRQVSLSRCFSGTTGSIEALPCPQ